MPERSVVSVAELDRRQRAVSREFLSHKRREIRAGRPSEMQSSMRQKPSLPWKQPRNMKLVNKFHEEAVIHVFQVLNTKPTVFPPLARSVPSNKAARAMAVVGGGWSGRRPQPPVDSRGGRRKRRDTCRCCAGCRCGGGPRRPPPDAPTAGNSSLPSNY